MNRYLSLAVLIGLVLGTGCRSGPAPIDSAEPPFAVLTLKVAG